MRGLKFDTDGMLTVMPLILVEPDRDRGEAGRGTTWMAEDGGRDAGGVPYPDPILGLRVCGWESDLRRGRSDGDEGPFS